MKHLTFCAAAAIFAVPAAASAQVAAAADVYVGASAGYHDLGVEDVNIGFDDDGGFIFGALAGVDLPVGETTFVGVEGNYHVGTDLIDSEYGVAARAGVRLDGGAKLFVRGGYQEVDFDLGSFEDSGFDDDEGDYLVGAGGEFPMGDGPAILRFGVDTIAFDTVRGTVALVYGF